MNTALRCLAVMAAGVIALSAVPAAAVTIISQGPNTDITLGLPFNDLEFENPLTGAERVAGYRVIEWRDADYAPGTPPWYDDWTVSHPGSIQGNVNEIWMRTNGHSATTTTTVASKLVSVHLIGDNNDGIAQVLVDGVEVARLDMGTQTGSQTALVVVKNLGMTAHAIAVNDLGAGALGGDDVAVMGAAALATEVVKWEQPPDPTVPTNLYYGWNEVSYYDGPQIAADDWVCTTSDPITHIRWWGSFLGWEKGEPPPVMPTGFHLTIWTDVPAGVDQPFSHPGQVVWEADCTLFTYQFVGWDFDPRNNVYEACFMFEQTLPPHEYFYQEAGPGPHIYWISIAAMYSTPEVLNPWGWKTRPREPGSPAPDDAVVILVPNMPHVGEIYQQGYPLWWPDEQSSWDLAFELTSQQTIEDLKWAQPPMYDPASPFPDCYWGWDEWSIFDSPQIVADDWVCFTPDPVTDIHWWGSYQGWQEPQPPPEQPVAFHIGIWTDVPAGIDRPYSHPGFMIWEWMVTTTDPALRVNVDGCDYHPRQPFVDTCFRYDWDIPQEMWFYQDQPGGIYWISIAAVYPTGIPPWPWGWKTRPHDYASPAPDDAVQIFDPTTPILGAPFINGRPIEEPQGVSWDTAFELTTKRISEPYVKWSQPPMPYSPPDAFNGWNEPSWYSGSQIVADDWVCTTENPVTDVHWWGSYVGWGYPEPPPDAPTAFHIAIWTDVPAGPGGWSHPGEMIWETVCTEFTQERAGWDFDPRDPLAPPETCFRFTQDLRPEEWFHQDPGTHVYWISIAAMYPAGSVPEHVFGWKTRPRVDSLAPDDAVAIFDPTTPALGAPFLAGQPLFWPTPDRSWDTAFILTSVEQPPPEELDFGDAPDPSYPTLLASNGARHTIVPGVMLGAAIDGELDGQPDPNALGDDNAGLADEDGVVFTLPLQAGQPATATVTASVPGVLWAWVDFDGDGTWTQATDQIFAGQALVAGPNVLGFNVPATAAVGVQTFARFRFTRTVGAVLGTTGLAPDGEVEDYAVVIEQGPQPTEFSIEFSLDIGSDTELSDPNMNGNEAFDPGDVYWWRSPPVIPPGRDGFKDDARPFGQDPWPDPPDPVFPPATRVPVGMGNPDDYRQYFDLDAHDELDVDLRDIIPPQGQVVQPIPQFPSHCIFPAQYLAVSFDDDMAPGWPAADVPVTRPSPAGMVYGTTLGSDEVIGVVLAPAVGGPAPLRVKFTNPAFDEVTVHASLAPNPDLVEGEDDDVDSLDVVEAPGACPFWYFSPDHEANLGLDPGGIYEVSPLIGPAIQVIDEVIHLGLPEDTDIDAFEFVWLEDPQSGAVSLALLFSVDEDDPLTPIVNESGGLDPRMIYVSFLNGASIPALDRPLQDDIDAIAAWRAPIENCFNPKQDADGDGDVDLTDFGLFLPCFNGPNRPWPPTANGRICACFDQDNDGDVDVSDFGVFQACFNGPNRPPASGCP